MEDTKVCVKCDEEKPLSDFRQCRLYRGMKEGEYTRSECKKCERKQAKSLHKAKSFAGDQPETCFCCEKYTKVLVVDHCHDTGNFRGWLCRNCNTGIGKLGDNIEGLEQALEYLKRTQNETVS